MSMLEPGLQQPAERPTSDEPIHASLSVIAPASLSGLRLDLRTGHWLVGRSGTIRFNTPGVSQQHAWIDADTTGTWVTDAGSKNGTTVNNRAITARTALNDGDIVTFGDVRARYATTLEDEATVRLSREAFRQADDAAQTETTRYLCAAVHIDDKFCTHVVNEVVDQPYRAVCPSYGVDLVAVAKHALLAQRRRMLRDIVLTGLLFLWAIVLLTALPGDRPTDDWSWFPWGISAAVALATWLVVGVELYWQRYVVLAQRLSQAAPQPIDIPPPFSRRLRARLESIARVQGGNVLIFSGYEPFIGSGARLGHWAFAIDVGKGAIDSETGTGKVPTPFTAGDLYDALTTNIAALGLPGLRIGERLFVNGRDAWRFRELLPSRQAPPTGQASPKLLRKLLELNRGSARTYLCFEVTGWRGQLVVTT
jgi:hypothetical protein